MNTKQKTNWWVDLVIFTGFITTFFLDLTGVAAHQWIGILCGGLAAYHLFLHRNWVGAVSERFFAKTSGQARIYYILDALLLLGFIIIGVTGLAISTWLNLSLVNFTTWLIVHITVSIATLVTLLLKLALHWRWIVHTTRKMWAKPVTASPENMVAPPVTASSRTMGRREFLRTMGVVGAASFLALANASKILAKTAASTEAAGNEDSVTQTESSSVAYNNQSSSEPSSSSNSCIVSCQRACSYPGHCHKYVDTNNNGHCDLGECIKEKKSYRQRINYLSPLLKGGVPYKIIKKTAHQNGSCVCT